MLPDLYDFQLDSLEQVRERFRTRGRRVVLSSGTGSGKTVIAAHMLAPSDDERRGLFVSDLITLTKQTVSRFDEYGIAHGVMQGSNTRGLDLPVVIATPQTIARRGLPGYFRLVVIDECHTIYDALMEAISELEPAPYVVGLTGTPFTEGLGDWYDAIAPGTPTYELIDRGYLTGLRVFVGVSANMRGLGTDDNGEWRDRDAAERGGAIVGEVVQWWEKKTVEELGSTRSARTLVFSATIEHGRILTRQFREAGHDFRQVYDDMPGRERDEAIDGFRAGHVNGLVSVNVLSKGFDVAAVNCLVLTRAFRRSVAAHLQQLGRGMRKYPRKMFCLVLDHGGNIVRHSARMEAFYTNGHHRLRKAGEEEDPVDAPVFIECRHCGYVRKRGSGICPNCPPRERLRDQRGPRQVPGVLVEWHSRRELARGLVEKYPAQELFEGCMTLAMDHYRDGNPERALPMARARYRTLTGRWPGEGMRFRRRVFLADLAMWWQKESDAYRDRRLQAEAEQDTLELPDQERSAEEGGKDVRRALRWRS